MGKKRKRNQTPQSKLCVCVVWRIFPSLRLNRFPRTSFLRQPEASGAYFSWPVCPLEKAHALVGFALSGDETQGISSCSRGTVPVLLFSCGKWLTTVNGRSAVQCLTNAEAEHVSGHCFSSGEWLGGSNSPFVSQKPLESPELGKTGPS